MRIALVGQWLRAAREDPVHRRTALRFATAIGLIQIGWILRLAVPDPLGLALIVVLGLVELSIPIWAEKAGAPTPWNAEHITERYGLFTIIVIGECLLAATSAIQAATDDAGLSGPLVAIAAGGLLLVFGLWWSYFKDSAALPQGAPLWLGITWGYGHYVIFASVAAIGVGLQIAVEAARGVIPLGPMAAAATVAIPVLTYFSAASVLHGRADPMRALRLAAGLATAILIGVVAAGWIGVPLAVLAMGAIVASTIVWHVVRGARRAPEAGAIAERAGAA
jgi:low temperature requirement protein LtrA